MTTEHVSVPRELSDEDVDRVAKIIADHIGHGMREKCYNVARAALESLPAASVPDGWKLVPVEPTDGMQDAHKRVRASGACHVWSTMLAAAPNPNDAKEECNG